MKKNVCANSLANFANTVAKRNALKQNNIHAPTVASCYCGSYSIKLKDSACLSTWQ